MTRSGETTAATGKTPLDAKDLACRYCDMAIAHVRKGLDELGRGDAKAAVWFFELAQFSDLASACSLLQGRSPDGGSCGTA